MVASISNEIITTVLGVGSGSWLNASGDVVVQPGELVVYNGGTIADTVVALGGETLISAGGSAIGTTVQNGGEQFIRGGTATATLIASGGNELPMSGGVTSGAIVLRGGGEGVNALGSAVGTFVDGGVCDVFSGGTASGTQDNGLVQVFSGGTDSGASVGSGGFLEVRGGADSGATVGSSGTLIVSSGGVANNVKTNDPNDQGVTAQINVMSGGTVDGSTKIDGGQLILDAGAVFEPHAKLTIINTGELVLEQNTFKGTIQDFGGQDFMDLSKIKFIGQGSNATTATFANGVLQVAQGNHIADLHLAGTYTTANFALQSDGAHGTTVTFVP